MSPLSIGRALLTSALTLGVAAMPLPGLAAESDMTDDVAVIGGVVVSKDKLSSFSTMLERYEGRRFPNQREALDEMALTLLHTEFVTTAALADKDRAATPLDYGEPLQRRRIGQALREKILAEIKPGDDDLAKWYNDSRSKFARPEEVDAYHLFVQVDESKPTSSSAEQRKRMEGYLKELDKGTSFVVLAKLHSEADSGRFGGDIGTIVKGRANSAQGKPMNPVLENALFSLKPGEHSQILSTSHGLHIVQVRDKRPDRTPSLKELTENGTAFTEAKNSLATSRVMELIAAGIEKHDGTVLTTDVQKLTTSTAAVKFAGHVLTFDNLEKLYDRAFMRQFNRVRDNPVQLEGLLKQVLQDLAFIQHAVDSGLLADSAIGFEVDLLGKRSKALRRMQAIQAEAYTATVDQQKAFYESKIDQYRQPEADGEIVIITPKSVTSVEDTVKNREAARKAADDARKDAAAGKSLTEIAEKLKSAQYDVITTAVAKHKLGRSADFVFVAFDQAAQGLRETGALSEVVSVGESSAFCKLGKRTEGDPVPFEQVRGIVASQVQQANQQAMREALLKDLKSRSLFKLLPGADALNK